MTTDTWTCIDAMTMLQPVFWWLFVCMRARLRVRAIVENGMQYTCHRA